MKDPVIKERILDKLRGVCEHEIECLEQGNFTEQEYWKGGKMALYDLCIDLMCASDAHQVIREVEESKKALGALKFLEIVSKGIEKHENWMLKHQVDEL